VEKSSKGNKQIYVYDAATATSMSDINNVFDGIGNVYQTPFLALYEFGECRFLASG
jgi:hypothetical protein